MRKAASRQREGVNFKLILACYFVVSVILNFILP
jgi:hypothetical protein